MHNRLKRMLIQASACSRFCILSTIRSQRAECVTHGPELYEVLQHGGCNEQTVHQRVGQEEDEELVVGEAYTVVDPGDAQTTERSASTATSWD